MLLLNKRDRRKGMGGKQITNTNFGIIFLSYRDPVKHICFTSVFVGHFRFSALFWLFFGELANVTTLCFHSNVAAALYRIKFISE